MLTPLATWLVVAALSSAPVEQAGLGEYVTFPASGVKVRQPEGFEKAAQFDGFGQAATQSSLMVVSLPAPFPQITAGFTQDQMKTRGWTFISGEETTVDGLAGVVVHFVQPLGGTDFLKWSVVFGDAQRTTLVTATFPKRLEAELSARLKSAALSVRVDRSAPDDPDADLPFTLTASPKLRRTPNVGRMLFYTKDGVIPARKPDDPMFIVAPSFGKPVAGDRREYAERRLRETALTKGLVVKSTDAITIDGLDGYESLAAAEDAKGGGPMAVYQVMLFDEGGYILMQGIMGAAHLEEYLPEFKAMARSLTRKRR